MQAKGVTLAKVRCNELLGGNRLRCIRMVASAMDVDVPHIHCTTIKERSRLLFGFEFHSPESGPMLHAQEKFILPTAEHI